MKRISFLLSLFALTVFFLPLPSHAALVPACSATGACGVCDILGTAITLGKWFVMGAAGLALVVIVNAGVTMATSAGNPEKIGVAKKGILGAVIGLGAVLLAFQFVAFIIFLVVTPSQYQTFEASQSGTQANKEQGARASLTSFLGAPWWTICSQNELVAAGSRHEKDTKYKGTAVCTYWGDDTPCGANAICCKGQCKSGFKPARKENGKDVPSDCPAYTQVSAQRAPLATSQEISEMAGKISSLALGVDSCILLNTQDENSVRECLKKAGITVYNTPGGYTSVAGLSRDTIDKLMKASGLCNFSCIVVTGGTEKGGHVANTSHGNPNVVDIDVNSQNINTVIEVMKRMGLQQVDRFPGTPGGWFVCDESARATGCDVTTSHLHVQF